MRELRHFRLRHFRVLVRELHHAGRWGRELVRELRHFRVLVRELHHAGGVASSPTGCKSQSAGHIRRVLALRANLRKGYQSSVSPGASRRSWPPSRSSSRAGPVLVPRSPDIARQSCSASSSPAAHHLSGARKKRDTGIEPKEIGERKREKDREQNTHIMQSSLTWPKHTATTCMLRTSWRARSSGIPRSGRSRCRPQRRLKDEGQ